MAVIHGRASRGGAAGVRALVSGLLEEIVLQSIEGCDAGLRVIVQHAEDQVFELQVVAGGVALLSGPPAPRPPCFYPKNLMEPSCGRGLILLKRGDKRKNN